MSQTPNTPTTPLTYKDAGVDIAAGDELVSRIKSAAKSTARKEVMGGLGGFGALFKLPSGYQEPVLVSGTDGVGTKLKLAIEYARHDHIGQDLVAMCVNDLVVCGAEPLFFLDYYATAKLELDVAASVIEGIADGCKLAGCALVGGETAEMPGMYQAGDYDLAGFCTGIVEHSKIIDGSQVEASDVLIALASSGAHSNGYSLIRKVIEVSGSDPATEQLTSGTLLDALMQPTRIYVKNMLKLISEVNVHAIAHITGGGLTENLPRVLPDSLSAQIDLSSWQMPELFDWLASKGGIEQSEMLKTFNCGIGMVIVVSTKDHQQALSQLKASGEEAFVIGEIPPRDGAAVTYR